MDTIFKVELVLEEGQHEEAFPLQEQTFVLVAAGSDRPAALIFAEQIAGTVREAASPLFVP
jgi:hypothetical protein